MKKIAFLCPYFGSFPKHFKLWLKSCEYNQDCEWFIYTDDHSKYEFPKNVHITYCTLKDLKIRISKKIGFEVALDTIQKLGDYKPLFGFIFEEEIKDFISWGHLDLNDSLYGKITNFLTDDMLNEYNKIMCCGHMSIYKNTFENNRMFMKPLKSGIDYKTIFTDHTFYNFEEIAPISITTIYIENNEKIKNMTGYYADISFRKYNMILSGIKKDFSSYYLLSHPNVVFVWDYGHIYGYYDNKGKIEKKEYIYIHLKRRKLNINIDMNEDRYIITQNGFQKYEEINSKYIKKNNRHKIIYKPFIDSKIKKFKEKRRK